MARMVRARIDSGATRVCKSGQRKNRQFGAGIAAIKIFGGIGLRIAREPALLPALR